MDPTHFDLLARSLTSTPSRRGTLAGLLAALAAGSGVAAARRRDRGRHDSAERQTHPEDGDQVGAEKKRKKKKKKNGAASACPEGQRRCRGTCQSVLICCDTTDCAGGRTCQQGTCACPVDKPVVCSGSTICQQCCVKADCTSSPAATGSGIPDCSGANVCACGPGLRYCPNTRNCGSCCSDAECRNGQICYNIAPLDALECTCGAFRRSCTAAGRTGCTADTSTCTTACGQPCNPQNGDAACPCSDDLVCDYTPGTQGAAHCAPR